MWAAVTPVVGVLAVCLANALAWVDRPFPGFLFLESGLIVSIGRADWVPPQLRRAQWTQLLAVDGRPVAGGHDAHARVQAFAPGREVTYRFRGGTEVFRLALPVRTFGLEDFLVLFGPMLGVGALMVLGGTVVALKRPRSHEVRGLFLVCLASGLNMITAADAYAPYWFGPVYFLSLAAIAPAILHVALAYPRRRRVLERGRVTYAVLYGPFLALGLVLLWWRFDPSVFLPALYTVYFLIVNASLLYVGGVVSAIIDGVRPLQPLVLTLGAVLGPTSLGLVTLVTYPLMQHPVSPVSLLAPLVLVPVLNGMAFLRFPEITADAAERP